MKTFLDLMDWLAFTTGLIGAPLGLIEIFRPDIADRMEAKLDFLGAQNDEGEFERMAQKYVVRFQNLVLIAFPIVIFLLYDLISRSSPLLDELLFMNTYWRICLWILVIIAFSGILFFLLAMILKGLDGMTGGHALGGFGVILILIGTLGDLTDKVITALVENGYLCMTI